MLAALLAVLVIFAIQAPGRVPSHFTASGDADDWSSKGSMVVFMTLIGVALPILLAIRWPWGRWPGVLNVPYKDFWLADGRQPGLTERVVTFMRLIAGLLCGLMGAMVVVMLVDSLAAGPAQTAPGWVFAVITVGFLVGVGLCVLKIYRDLKPRDPQGNLGTADARDRRDGR